MPAGFLLHRGCVNGPHTAGPGLNQGTRDITEKITNVCFCVN